MSVEPEKIKPRLIAVTGGIGAGKSTALDAFARLGAAVLSSDAVVHELLEDEETRRQISDSLGLEGLERGAEGRRRLAEAVFNDEGQMERLTEILYPRVREEMLAWAGRPPAATAPLAVIEVPMLFEAGMEGLFDAAVLVTAPEELRRQRSRNDDFESRAARQLPEAEKQARCAYSYDNRGTVAELEAFIAGIFAVLARGEGEPCPPPALT